MTNDNPQSDFEKVREIVELKQEIARKRPEGAGKVIHELSSDITSKPSDEYLAQHGTTGATIKRHKTWIAADTDGNLMLQDVIDTQCSPATGPKVDVKDEEKISMKDAVSRIMHDLENMSAERRREEEYNPDVIKLHDTYREHVEDALKDLKA